MAISKAVAVDDSGPVLVHSASSEGGTTRGSSTLIRNVGASPAYLGGPDVTTADGTPFLPDEALGVDLLGESLHAVCDAGETTDLRVLVTR